METVPKKARSFCNQNNFIYRQNDLTFCKSRFEWVFYEHLLIVGDLPETGGADRGRVGGGGDYDGVLNKN